MSPTPNDVPRPAPDADHEPQHGQLFAMGEQLASQSDGTIDETGLKTVANQLISLYDNTYSRASLRERAADVVKDLASRYDSVLDLVVLSARRYSRTQHIDDAFPYHPNGFNVLAATRQQNTKVIAFLTDVIRKDWGIPRWDAIGALCRIDDPDAESTIVDVIRGNYPSRNPDVRNDLREIEQVKGRSFVEQYQVRIGSTRGSRKEVEAEIRIGNLRATICPEEIDGQFACNIKLERLDQRSNAWSSLCSLGFHDIPVAKQVLERAQSRIDELKQSTSQTE